MRIYAIWDVKANAIQNNLYPFPNDEVAKRAFSAAISNPGPELQLMAKYPDDFFLVCLGELEQHGTGKILPIEEDSRVACLGDLKQ